MNRFRPNAPAGVRYNSPNALSRSPYYAQNYGATPIQIPGETLAAFPNKQLGMRANYHQMLVDQSRMRGNRISIRQLVNQWATTATPLQRQNYVARVAKMTGLNPDQPLDLNDPTVAAAVAQAQSVVEDKGAYYSLSDCQAAIETEKRGLASTGNVPTLANQIQRQSETANLRVSRQFTDTIGQTFSNNIEPALGSFSSAVVTVNKNMMDLGGKHHLPKAESR